MNCETDTNAASPGASKRPKLDMPAEADGTKAETDSAMPQDFTLSKEALLQGKAEESVVGKRIKHASASEIAALISGGAKTAADMPDDRPLQKGHKGLLIKWDRDGEYYRAEIIERRWQKDAKRWHYYVHYTDFNRRLDQWVTPDRILLKVRRGTRRAERRCARRQKAVLGHWSLWDGGWGRFAGGRGDDQRGHGDARAEDCADRRAVARVDGALRTRRAREADEAQKRQLDRARQAPCRVLVRDLTALTAS